MKKKTIFVTENPVEVAKGIFLRLQNGVLVVEKEPRLREQTKAQ